MSAVGVFDSGMGGLSVLGPIRALLPEARLVYAADSGHVPYGPKSAEYIRHRSERLATFLLERGAGVIVIACNTATAAAAEHVRGRFEVPIVAMEPAIKPAAAATRSGVVGVLATSGTLASARFAALLDRFGDEIRVVDRPAPDLVLAVEAGRLEAADTRERVRAHVGVLREAGADVIVLGCTHFAFLRALVEAEAGPGVAVIDTGAAVARRLAAVAAQRGIRLDGGGEEFWTTGGPEEGGAVMEAILGRPVTARPVPAPYA